MTTTPTATLDPLETVTERFDDSNNVVDYRIEHYDNYDSLLVEFTPRGYNFVLLQGDVDMEVKDISAIHTDGHIHAVIHIYGVNDD
jgi:hypothetical protein